MSRRARRTTLLAILATAMGIAMAIPLLTGMGRVPKQDVAWEAAGNESPLLTEFGDFQCPHCARFALGILPHLERDMIVPGKVRFEYRHYPFMGPESLLAAEAAECARDQGEFGQYHQQIYVKLVEGYKLDGATLKMIADETGLEDEQFGACLDGRLKEVRVLEDKQYGEALGIKGTPTLFLNGKEIQWEDYPDLRRQISEAVQQAETASQTGLIQESEGPDPHPQRD